MRKQYINLKDNLDVNDLCKMNPKLLVILSFINMYCHENGIDFQVTSMYRSPEHNKRVGAKSQTHVQDRAFDFSIREEHGWDYNKVQELVDLIQENEKFMEYGAKVWADKNKTKLISRPIVIHKVKGGVMHAHVQVSP